MTGEFFKKTPLSGKLRHCIDIESRVEVQDPVSGAMTETWEVRWKDVRAEIRPLSAREFLSANAMQVKATAMIRIRQRCDGDIQPLCMRAVHKTSRSTKIYNIHGALPDPDSGNVYVTLVVSEGVNNG